MSERFAVNVSTAEGGETRVVGRVAKDFLLRAAQTSPALRVEVAAEDRSAAIAAAVQRIATERAAHFPEKPRRMICLTPGTRGAGRIRPHREPGTFDAMRGAFGTDVRSQLRLVK